LKIGVVIKIYYLKIKIKIESIIKAY
jgi:hypothetical protein